MTSFFMIMTNVSFVDNFVESEEILSKFKGKMT